MPVTRIVPDLPARSLPASQRFYAQVLGLETAMDLGWVVILANPERRDIQLILLTQDRTAPVRPAVSIEVDDVDAVHRAARETGVEIVYPLTDEDWGVRRFFARDPDGTIINILAHRTSGR